MSSITVTHTEPAITTPTVGPTHFTLSREVDAIETATWTVSDAFPWQVDQEDVVEIARRQDDETAQTELNEEHVEEFCEYARRYMNNYCPGGFRGSDECFRWETASALCDIMEGKAQTTPSPVPWQPSDLEAALAEIETPVGEQDETEQSLPEGAPTSLNIEALDPANKPVETPSPAKLAYSEKKYKLSPWRNFSPPGKPANRQRVKHVEVDATASSSLASSLTGTATEPASTSTTTSAAKNAVGLSIKAVGLMTVAAALVNLSL